MIKLIKRTVRKLIPRDSNLDFWVYMHYRWKPAPGSIEEIIDRYSKRNKQLFFMQIGSNDGKSGDPLHKFIRRDAWQGILVEPVDYLFDQLRENYRRIGNNGLIFENIAIADQVGYRDFFYFEDFTPDESNPVTLNQQGSFSETHINQVKTLFPKAKTAVRRVPCDTVQSVLSKHCLPRLDILHIDTEGYDFEIIKTINFEDTRPALILYEHIHLSKEDEINCQSLLKDRGYLIFKPDTGYDTLAYQPHILITTT